jgi:hypothetical protein
MVLRRALAPGAEVRLVVGEYDAPGDDPRYASVIVDGEPLEVPKPPAETPGTAAYMLAAPGRLLMLGAGSPAAAGTPPMFIAKPGPPAAADGADGAVYLDTATLRLWGPKAAGAWPVQPLGRIVPLAPTYAQLTTG